MQRVAIQEARCCISVDFSIWHTSLTDEVVTLYACQFVFVLFSFHCHLPPSPPPSPLFVRPPVSLLSSGRSWSTAASLPRRSLPCTTSPNPSSEYVPSSSSVPSTVHTHLTSGSHAYTACRREISIRLFCSQEFFHACALLKIANPNYLNHKQFFIHNY